MADLQTVFISAIADTSVVLKGLLVEHAQMSAFKYFKKPLTTLCCP